MKKTFHNNYTLIILFFFLFTVKNTNAQAVGDYGSNASGNWTSGYTWLICTTPGTWTGATTTTTQPTGIVNKNIWIRSGHTVTVTSGPAFCLNLVVESGAILKGGTALPTSSIVYVRVYGTSLTVNGTWGVVTGDNLSIEFFNNVTVSGPGNKYFSRIRPGSNQINKTLTIDCDLMGMYNGSTGGGGSSIYADNNAANDGTTITINSGRTVTMAAGAYFGSSSGGSSDGGSSCMFQINGNLTMGKNGIVNIAVANGKTSSFNVGATGTVNLAKDIIAPANSAGTAMLSVAAGGKIIGGTGNIELSRATSLIHGTIDFNTAGTSIRSLGSATVSSTGLIRLKDGNWPAGTIVLQDSSTVEYYGTTPFTCSGTATLSNLHISNTAGVTFVGETIINGSLVIDSGAILKYNGTGLTLGSDSHIINGTLGIGNAIANSGTITWGSASTLAYIGSSLQTTTDIEFPFSGGPKNLAIYNPAGVNLHTSRTINDLTLTNGVLSLGSNNLTLNGTISGTPNGTNMVDASGTGELRKNITSVPASFIFPVGSGGIYSPANVTLVSGTLASAYIGVKVSATKSSHNTSATNYINRTWTLSANGIASPVHTDTLTYAAGDVTGAETNLVGGLYAGATWSNLGMVNTAKHYITGSGLTSFGELTAGESSAFTRGGSVTVKVIPQGYYNSGDYLNSTDTIHVYLANVKPPYDIVDSAIALLDSVSFTATATFNNAATASYYVVVKQRTCVETWSASAIPFAQGAAVVYDFTDAQSKAYQDNQIPVHDSPVRWAMYCGDVNQDGYVDPLDLSIIDLDSFNYASGLSLVTDINGDHFVDPLDMSIADLNSFNYVGIKRPVAEKRSKAHSGQQSGSLHYNGILRTKK